MPRDLRHIPPDSLVEVTNRTLEGRFFLRPDEECTDLLRGVVTWAAAKHAMPLVAQVWLSAHYHLLALPEDACRRHGLHHGSTITPQGKRPTGIERIASRSSTAITVTSPLTPLVV